MLFFKDDLSYFLAYSIQDIGFPGTWSCHLSPVSLVHGNMMPLSAQWNSCFLEGLWPLLAIPIQPPRDEEGLNIGGYHLERGLAVCVCVYYEGAGFEGSSRTDRMHI